MTDFAAEGLLDGVEGEARAARLELLERLEGEGVTLEELRSAVEAARLTLLPAERALAGGGPRYTAREIAELAGLDLERPAALDRGARHPQHRPRRAQPDRRRPGCRANG